MLTIAGKTLKTISTVPLVCAALMSATAFAQAPPYFAPPQLDSIVARVALYPDPLLAQVMAAATFSNQIPDAARWADEHHYITGDALAAAITADQLPWDPSVQALLPFPNILDMMASDPAWTQQLGDAFLSNSAGRDGCRAAPAPPGLQLWLSPLESADRGFERSLHRHRTGQPLLLRGPVL